MESIVIVMGGSVLLSEAVDTSFFQKLKDLVKKTCAKHRIYVVAGGGKTARRYIKLGRSLGFTEKELDQIGINVTRINASFLTYLFDNSNKTIPENVEDAIKENAKVIVMGGTTLGHSTDMVGAELAQKTNSSKLIIATNVDGVYDKDPNKFNDAKKYDELHIEDLIKMCGTKWGSAGKNIVIDGPALEIIKDSKINTIVLNGKKIEELEKAFFDKLCNGTKIKI